MQADNQQPAQILIAALQDLTRPVIAAAGVRAYVVLLHEKLESLYLPRSLCTKACNEARERYLTTHRWRSLAIAAHRAG